MKATRIKTLTIAAIFAAVMLVAMIGLPFEFLVGTIEKKFRNETGYSIRFTDGAKLSLLPSPVLTISKVTVLDESGLRAETRVSAERVQIALSLWSLFFGRPRLTEVTQVIGVLKRDPLLN